jgi:hypothetical protein
MYRRVCGFGVVENAVLKPSPKSSEKNYVTNSELYPEQDVCLAKVDAKMNAWKDLAHLLMSKGIAKSYQNDKDAFAETVK